MNAPDDFYKLSEYFYNSEMMKMMMTMMIDEDADDDEDEDDDDDDVFTEQKVQGKAEPEY